jgi:Metallopeptidase toxin 3
MKMNAGDIKNYPKFAQYVRYAIPELIYVKPVASALKKNGSLTEAKIRHALQWGNEPLIVITDLSHGQCGVPSAYGCTRQANLHQIEIDVGTVNDFETSPYGLGVGKNAKGNNVFIVGVTLVHELCHLGNFKHHKAEAEDAGFAFENSVYGKAVP